MKSLMSVISLVANSFLISSHRCRRATTSRQISVGKAYSASAGLFHSVRLDTSFDAGSDLGRAVSVQRPS